MTALTTVSSMIRQPWALIIEKYIEEEGSEHKPLKGVTFLVTDSSGAVVGNSNGEFISGDDGRVVIPGVEPGSTISVREIKVPEGVVLDGIPKTIKISDDGANVLRFYNKKTGYLVVRKLDKISKEPLSGVEFEFLRDYPQVCKTPGGGFGELGCLQLQFELFEIPRLILIFAEKSESIVPQGLEI